MPTKRQPKPRHDWREDARELAIIVIGAFIALIGSKCRATTAAAG